MSAAQLTKSLDISAPKAALSSGVSAHYARYRSDNTTYTPGDVITFSIPTGGSRNQYLLPQESFLELQMTAAVADITGGTLKIDNSIYSAFQSCRIWHGSNLLVEVNNAGRLWNMLLDAQSSSGRYAAQTMIGCGLYPWDGRPVPDDATSSFKFAIPLPVALLGTLAQQATPLGLMTAGDIRVELGLVPNATQIFTTCLDTGAANACTGTATAGVAAPAVTFTNIAYNAKISTLSGDLNMALLESFQGRPISLPSTGFSVEQAHVPAGITSFSTKINAQYSSLKAIMWWNTSQTLALGTITANNLGRSNARYAGGPLTQFWVDIQGVSIPSDRNIAVSSLGDTCPADGAIPMNFHSSIAMAQMQRVFNELGAAESSVSFPRVCYGNSAHTYTEQVATPGRFVGAVDLERADGDAGETIYAGMNTKNSSVDLHFEFSAATTVAQICYMVSWFDTTYTLDNGSLIKSD